jgi:diguanylate cyclase (GGDEF)-like protein
MDNQVSGGNVVTLGRPQRTGPPASLAQLAGIGNDAIVDGLFTLLEGMPGLATITDIDGAVLYMNERGRKTLGITNDEELHDRRLAQSYPAKDAQYLFQQAIPFAMHNQTWRGEMTMIDAAGDEIPVSQVIIFQRTSGSEEDGFLLSIAWDMREQKRTENILRHKATHDELTGLPNRTLLVDRLTQALNVSKRDKKLTAVIFMDLNRFKAINDHFGHESANRILQEAARRFESCVRSVDTVGRYGGDEFVFVLPNLNHADQVEPVLKRIRNVLDAPFRVGKRKLSLTVSSGIATYPADGTEAATLLHRADQEMYRNKRLRSTAIERLSESPQVDRRGGGSTTARTA